MNVKQGKLALEYIYFFSCPIHTLLKVNLKFVIVWGPNKI